MSLLKTDPPRWMEKLTTEIHAKQLWDITMRHRGQITYVLCGDFNTQIRPRRWCLWKRGSQKACAPFCSVRGTLRLLCTMWSNNVQEAQQQLHSHSALRTQRKPRAANHHTFWMSSSIWHKWINIYSLCTNSHISLFPFALLQVHSLWRKVITR